MSAEAPTVDTLFLHGRRGDRGYLVGAHRNGERVLAAKLTLKETDAGPRPARFRLLRDGTEEPRDPAEFVELARRSAHIRISEQTGREARSAALGMLDGYQLEAAVVRTCRHCAAAGRFAPITEGTAVSANDGRDDICGDCAIEELDRELAYRGDIAGAARERLRELLLEVRDLDRITNLLSGRLDPELTKVDEISATADDVEPLTVGELDLHPAARERFEGRFDELLPVQSRAVSAGLLDGEDQLVVSATATGKTLVGELAGIDRTLRGRGKLLFLVPLVALANQKYGDFREEYGDLVDVTIRVGASRVRGDGRRFDPEADVIVGTYEGIDHALRTGRDLGDIGTVVIDEVHTLVDEERGHRLDGLIARLKEYCDHRRDERASYEGAQWIYLSATVGNPAWLAERLGAALIEYEERPVPIERHVTFADGHEKPEVIDRLVRRAYDRESSKGFRGQTIVFTNSRRRCHEISRRVSYPAAAYHAGLDNRERKAVERRFADGELAAVVTTAALGAGVDFPASQVVFDALAMGIEWLTVQEFEQMLGRAGRPDYHDRGTVYLLVEPGGRYHRGMDRTEDEVAFTLLQGGIEAVRPRYDDAVAAEEMLANVVVGGERAMAIAGRMVGTLEPRRAIERLLADDLLDGVEPTPLGRAVAEHFLRPAEAVRIREDLGRGRDPLDIVADLQRREP